ncbi:hypothetical protein [Clostridium sp. SM-530-WT-3G]|uniref:hypothetical protein n=1 Tax=Clostridium sp. SM-530-WT-3G TaxID=2725303 RepID=UPI00145E3C2C|nr:hypothetical protein [Clostridium sp. SM-530-WT-3G]NME82479.1 hypothetical protein [Clostridium sp. SM-530-WT-3G]
MNGEKFLGLVKEVEGENPINFTKWDIWYRIEDFAGGINKDDYCGNIDKYYKKLIDKNGESEEKIKDIFEKVYSIDSDYSTKINDKISSLKDVISGIDKICERIK